MKKLWKALKLEVQWLKPVEHRKQLYKTLKALGPILSVVGLFTPSQVSQGLILISGLLLLGGSTVADRNAK